MDERTMMERAGMYQPPATVEDLTPGQKEIMVSLFGKYYRQAGSAMMYLKTDNGQKIVGTALLLVLLAIATKKLNPK
jgi:hypothetical protein